MPLNQGNLGIRVLMIQMSEGVNILAGESAVAVERHHFIRYNTHSLQAEQALLYKLCTMLYMYRTQFSRFLWQPVPLPELSPRTIRSLVSTTQYQRRHGLPSNGVARKRLMERGSVQIKLGGKTLWVETPAPDGVWTVPTGTLP